MKEGIITLTSDDEIEKRFIAKVKKNNNEYFKGKDAYVNFSKSSIAKMWLFLNDNGVQVYQFMAMHVNRRKDSFNYLDPKTGEETGEVNRVPLNLDHYYNDGFLACGMTQTFIEEGTGIHQTNIRLILKLLLELKWIKELGKEKVWKNKAWIPVPIYGLGRVASEGGKPTEAFFIDLVDNPESQITRNRKKPGYGIKP